MTFLSGPFNIQQGNTAQFNVEFLDTGGALSVPSSASMTVTYTNTSYSTQVDTVTLSQNGLFFTGTWSSATAALGLATWVAYASPSGTAQIATGQLRIIQRQGA